MTRLLHKDGNQNKCSGDGHSITGTYVRCQAFFPNYPKFILAIWDNASSLLEKEKWDADDADLADAWQERLAPSTLSHHASSITLIVVQSRIMNDKIILYGSYSCPMVPPVRDLLKRAEAEFDYVNISTDAEGKQRVKEINQGYESVPTLEFPDGSTMTEPRMSELEAKLTALGYEIPPVTIADRLRGIAQNPLLLIAGLIVTIWGATGGGMPLTLIGVGVLAVHLLARFLL